MRKAYSVRVVEDGEWFRGEVVEVTSGLVVHSTGCCRRSENARRYAINWVAEMPLGGDKKATLGAGQWDRLVEMMRTHAGVRHGQA